MRREQSSVNSGLCTALAELVFFSLELRTLLLQKANALSWGDITLRHEARRQR